jgi:hypothetical protein
MKYPVSVARLLATIFTGTPAEHRLKEGAIWEVWGSAVGDQIASRARPCAIRNGVLTVIVSSAPWMQQLNFLKIQLMEKLNSAIGEELVKEIYFKAGSLKNDSDAPIRKPAPARIRRNLTCEEQETVARATEKLADPELRKTLSSLYSLHLASSRNQDPSSS